MTTAPPTAPTTGTQPFSAMLRGATWARHQGVDPTTDNSDTVDPGILGALFDGDLHLDDFTAWTAQQYFVYEALDEAAKAMRDHPIGGRFVFDELSRAAAFDADLTLLIGPHWRDRITPIASNLHYLKRIREVCHDWAGGYIAHSYTRYLGDMSGGQAFRAAANDLYGFADGPGVRFYIFDGIDDMTEWKAEYRRRLDAAPFGLAEKHRIIAEVLDAYDFNSELLAELGRHRRRTV